MRIKEEYVSWVFAAVIVMLMIIGFVTPPPFKSVIMSLQTIIFLLQLGLIFNPTYKNWVIKGLRKIRVVK
jgi:hypothetical protein